MPKHKSEDYKLSAVKYYLKNKNQVKTCKIFECSERSLMRWVIKYNDTKRIIRKEREYKSYKITKDQVKFILDELKKNKTITLKELLNNLKDKYPNIIISQYHIYRIIKDNYFSLKLTRFRHEPILRFGKEINIKNKLRDFYKEISNYDIKNIICIDETNILSLQKRKYCYSEIGKRCIIKTHSQEVFKKYTGIFAISINSVIGWEIYKKGGIDTNRLSTFLEKYISKYRNKVVILDNASSHRSEIIKNKKFN